MKLPRIHALVERLPKGPIAGAEIGVFRGRMSRGLLWNREDLFLFMVDSWGPSEQWPERYRATGDFHAKMGADRQEENAAEAAKKTDEYADRRKILRMRSVDAARYLRRTFGDGILDFVFIDADHSFEGVVEDIEAWRTLVVPGGLISGHDYNHPGGDKSFGVTEAVDAAVEKYGWELELGEDTTWFVRRPV